MTLPESPVQDTDRLREVADSLITPSIIGAFFDQYGAASIGMDSSLSGWPRKSAKIRAGLIAAFVAALPVHREMVLAEVAHELGRRATTVPWSDPTLKRGIQYAASVVSVLARDSATSPPPPPPGSPPADERVTAVPEGTHDAVTVLATALDQLGARIYRDLHDESSYVDPTNAEAIARTLADFSAFAEKCLTALDDPRVLAALAAAKTADPPAAVPGTGDDPQRSLEPAAPPITNTPVSLQVERPTWNVTAWRDRDDIAWTWEDGRWYIQDGYLDAETCGPHYDLDDLREHHGADLTPLDVDNVPALLAEHGKLRTELAKFTALPGTPTYGQLLRSHAELLDQQDEWRKAMRSLGEEFGQDTARLEAERDALRDHASFCNAEATKIAEAQLRVIDQRDAAVAERDRLAETIRRYEPVIEAAKAWLAYGWNGSARLTAAIRALGEIPSPTAPEAPKPPLYLCSGGEMWAITDLKAWMDEGAAAVRDSLTMPAPAEPEGTPDADA